MSKLTNFRPTTPQQGDEAIGRVQTQFNGGVRNDGLAKSVGANELYYLINGIAFEDSVQGRTGNRLFSTTLPPDIATGVTATKASTYIFTDYAGMSSDFVGRIFRWPDGTDDPILEVTQLDVNSWKLLTDNGTSHADTSAGKFRYDIHCFEWHDTQRKWIMQMGPKLYTADWDMSAWTEVCWRGTQLSESKSQCKIWGNKAIIGNSAGLFLVSFEKETIEYWKVNASGPTVRGADKASSTYLRKILTTFLTLKGDSIYRQRTDAGCAILHETPSNRADVELIDYMSVWTSVPIDNINAAIYDLDATSISAHHTHYGVYATEDCGVNGVSPSIGAGNNTERFFWLYDIPVIKVARVDRSYLSTGFLTEDGVPFLDKRDLYSTIKIFNTSNGSFQVTTISDILYDYSGTTMDECPYSPLADYLPAIIGGDKVCVASKSGTTVTIEDVPGGMSLPLGSTFSASDIGKTLFWEDGTYDVIKSYTDSKHVEVWASGTKTSSAVGWDPTSRSVWDDTPDSDLSDRTPFLLKQRSLRPLPNPNVIDISSDNIFTASAGDDRVYYGSLSERSMIGSYHPGNQLHHLEHAVLGISVFANAAIIYGPNAFTEVDLSATKLLSDEDTGQSNIVRIGDVPIKIFLSWRNVKGRGILDRGAYRKTKGGYDIVVTNLRELCTHDGYKFSENLVADKIMNKLNLLQAVSAIHYDEISGFIFWGTEDEPV